MRLFVTEISENGVYKEVYVYLRGRLLYKAWLVRGEKTASRTFQSSGFSSLQVAERGSSK